LKTGKKLRIQSCSVDIAIEEQIKVPRKHFARNYLTNVPSWILSAIPINNCHEIEWQNFPCSAHFSYLNCKYVKGCSNFQFAFNKRKLFLNTAFVKIHAKFNSSLFQKQWANKAYQIKLLTATCTRTVNMSRKLDITKLLVWMTIIWLLYYTYRILSQNPTLMFLKI
jgi:hypothetical protein